MMGWGEDGTQGELGACLAGWQQAGSGGWRQTWAAAAAPAAAAADERARPPLGHDFAAQLHQELR